MVLNWIKKISGKTDKKQEKDTKKSTAKKAVVKKAVVKKDKTVLQQNKDSSSKSGFLGKLFKGLGKSSAKISENITGVFTKRKLDKEAIQDLEDILIMSDMGVELSKKMANNLAKNKFEKESEKYAHYY